MEDGSWRSEVGGRDTEIGNWRVETEGYLPTSIFPFMIKSYKDLEVHQMAYVFAMDIFYLSKRFPKEETYSLTSQIIRSSRSISANIAEGWAKREYENVFKQHLIHSLGS